MFLPLLLAAASATTSPTTLKLVDHGKTDYVIVTGSDAQSRFAASELKESLFRSTGVQFTEVSLDKAASANRRIVIGDNALSRKLLGGQGDFKPDEAVIAVRGDDLILSGEGERGPLYALYSFLENDLGFRWYTAYGEGRIPRQEVLEIGGPGRREPPAFGFRNISQSSYQIRPQRELFFFRNRLNTIQNSQVPELKSSLPEIGPPGHTLFFYINPEATENPAWKGLPYPEEKDFFRTHPEFFSMNAEGNRVKTLQLCFSNPGLRETMTRQVNEVIRKNGREKGVVSIDANDVPGRFCHCSDCEKLERHYGTPAGPLLDYLIELCGKLETSHPGVAVRTLAYRKKQSEVPPSNVEALPRNLIIVFAPIESDFAANFSDPRNREMLDHLKGWIRIAKDNVWVWYYSNPYLSPLPPYANIEKLTDDMRTLRDCGVSGIYCEHDSGVAIGLNFSELQTWLLLKLIENPDCDVKKLVREFTDYYYGPAAPMMRDYLGELETVRKAIAVPMPWNPSFSHFSYCTPERLVRWEADFDRMETLAQEAPEALLHIRTARIALDIAMLRRWHAIKKQSLSTKETPESLNIRILASFDAMAQRRFPTEQAKAVHAKLLHRDLPQIFALAQAEAKPLPEPFSSVAEEDLRRAFPVRNTFPDAEAACGFAAGKGWEKTPVEFGLYDNVKERWTLSRKIEASEIQPGRYAFYKLGKAPITSHCLLWITEGWTATVPLEQFYVVGEPFIEWEIYASLKFEGPLFGETGSNTPNRVFCDQVILVRAKKPSH